MDRVSAPELTRLLGDWADDADCLPEALCNALTELIDLGFLPAGCLLPPQRALASSLAISRGTVTAALERLQARGYSTSRRGSGTRVRCGRSGIHNAGRLVSLSHSPSLTDLSTGALPASQAAREVLLTGLSGWDDYLDTDGYFPAGLPVLRAAIAQHLTASGVDTRPEQILVTNGAQQATNLAVRSLHSPGDLVLCDDPTYRGALEVFASAGLRVEGIPMRSGLVPELVARAIRRQPRSLYCQTSVHNPTGRTMPAVERRALAEVVTRAGLPVIEDCCSWDLTLTGIPSRTLAGLVDPELLVSCWTMSKLFWGGIRIGWLRAAPERVRAMAELRKGWDLASSVPDQLLAVRLLAHAPKARRERAAQLESALKTTTSTLRQLLPEWSWESIDGGSGLWVDTGADTVALAEKARRVAIKLAPGPSFSPHEGSRTMLRLPIWHDHSLLTEALLRIAALLR